MHRFVLHNGEILDAHAKSLSAGQVGLLNGWGVFSTLRVADGVPFAFERHWRRMHRDAEKLHVPFPQDREEMRAQCLKLIEANRASNATLRIMVVRNRGGLFEGPDLERDFDVLAFTKDLSPWGASVRLDIKRHARHSQYEFSGCKMLSWAENLTWYEETRQKGFDEVLLLNEGGEVCECTSANVFAAKSGPAETEVWTPPLSSGCLPGITREVVLGEVHVPGMEISEKVLMPADLEAADEVFITSTTRDLLPVRQIEDRMAGSSDSARIAMQTAFSHYVDGYIAAHKQPEPVR